MASAAFCDTGVRLLAGAACVADDAMGCVASAAFSATGLCLSWQAQLICKRCKAKVNPVRASACRSSLWRRANVS